MEELPLVALGALLHDIGKVIQRADLDPMKCSHSKFGARFLETADLVTANQNWQWVIESVQYHHWKDIKEGRASLPIAWFVFEADNLASAHDRRDAPALFDSEGNRLEETDKNCSSDWDRFRRLDSIFTNFRKLGNENEYPCKLPLWYRGIKDNHFYREPYPYPESGEEQANCLESYQVLRDKILSQLVQFLKTQYPCSLNTVNAVLHYLEESLSMVPPDTYKKHTNDVSLYDHLKLTAAIAGCMYAYVADRHPDWLSKPGRQIPWDREFRNEPAYLLVKADMSGIQEFIYNVSSKAALKGLRGRSFYLEFLQTHVSDHLLEQLKLSRANLLYQGGGGFTLLVPNTPATTTKLTDIRSRFNKWLFNAQKGRLFMALEWTELTGNQLRTGSDKASTMASAWIEIAEKIGQTKGEKFKEILADVFQASAHVEECTICHRDDLKLVENQEGERTICQICQSLIEIGRKLPDADIKENGGKGDELHIRSSSNKPDLLPDLNANTNLTAAIDKPDRDSFVLHNYDLFRPPKLFWSLYRYGNNEFDDLAQAAQGVKRIAVLRADVDNLGKIFSGRDEIIGLPQELRSISRDAAVSRSLARFFSHYLDDLLRSECAHSEDGKWAITTVYAGGDDVFLVGAWNQVLEFALFLREKFMDYTCGRITLSAGIAIQKPHYPFYRLAQEAKEAEDVAKSSRDKDRDKDCLCVKFDDRIFDTNNPSHCFKWINWDTKIKPLVSQLNALRQVGLSSGFLNFLLQYCRSINLSFYKLLYSVARMEERCAQLRKNDMWQDLKQGWIFSLKKSESCTLNAAHLETALNWHILLDRKDVNAERMPEPSLPAR